MKTCKKCKEIKSLDDFYRNNNTKDGRLSICKECNRVKNPTQYPRWRKYHPDLVREAMKMKSEGFSIRIIEADLGIPKSALRNYFYGKAKPPLGDI